MPQTEKFKLFYNPKELEESVSIPVVKSSLHRQSIKQFLLCIESKVESVIADLKRVRTHYMKDMEQSFYDYIHGDSPSLWAIIKTDHSNLKMANLRNHLCAWALKWNLTDGGCQNAVYLEIALYWIIKSQHDNNLKLKLSECIPDEEDCIPRFDFFNREYPFVFAPVSPWPNVVHFNMFDTMTYEQTENNILENCEELDNRRRMSVEMQERKGLTYPWVGKGWNPTKDDWDTFWSEIDILFKEYTKAYKERIERIMKSQGFKGKPPKEEKYNFHFEWLTEYQFNENVSYHDIAVHHNLPRRSNISRDERWKTVKNGVKTAADLALIPLRSPSDPGPKTH